MLHASGDSEAGIEVALSWRLLVLHGRRTRRLTLPTAGAPSGARIAAQASPAQLGAPPGVAATAPGPERGAGPRRHGVRDRLTDLQRTVDVVRRLVARSALRVTRLDGWLEFALHDVGETGRAFGFASALATLLDPLGRFALYPRWDTEDRLAADLVLEIRVQPLRTLLVLLGERLRRRAPSPATVPDGATGGSLAA